MSTSSAQPNAWSKRLVLTADDEPSQSSKSNTKGNTKATTSRPSPRPSAAPPQQPKPKQSSSRNKPSPIVFNLLDSLLASSSKAATASSTTSKAGKQHHRSRGVPSGSTHSIPAPHPLRRGAGTGNTGGTAAQQDGTRQRAHASVAPRGHHVASRAAKPKRPSAIKRAVLQRRQQVVRGLCVCVCV